MRLFVLFLLIPVAMWGQATKTGRGGNPQPNSGGTQATPPPPPPTPAADLATMEGQVLNATGGTPLRKATITVNRVNVGPNTTGRSNYSATTDAAGRYSITGIEPGTYRLSASHTGFLTMQYNARRPQTAGTNLDFGRAEKKTGVDFKLTPHGVITGKITDEDGDPLEGVQIQVMRVMYNQGRKQLQPSGGASTNDLGEYRLTGITPGKFYIAATYRGQMRMIGIDGMAGADDDSSQEDYVTTYYPGVTDINAASPLEMGPGDQAQGVNLRLTKIHTVRISGRAIDSSSPPPPEPPSGGRGGLFYINSGPDGLTGTMPVNPRIQVRLQPRGGQMNPNSMMQGAVAKIDGTFDFASVAPGSYYLIANQGGRGGAMARATKQAIDVGSSNIEGLTLTISPGATVTGHVHYDGDPPSPLPSLTVRLTPREPTAGLLQPQPAKVDADGNFRLEEVNLDLYNVTINTPQGLYLKSLRSGSTDVLVSGLDLSSGAAALDILMGTNPPQVGGSVLNPATEQPAPAVTVVLMPREKERQGQSYFYYTTTSDQYGNFSMSRVIPGAYDVYAWEAADYGLWFDPEWMKAYEGKGEVITAQEGSPVNVKLTMIPAK